MGFPDAPPGPHMTWVCRPVCYDTGAAFHNASEKMTSGSFQFDMVSPFDAFGENT